MNEKETILELRRVLRLKHLALSTERSYCGWVRRLCRQIPTMPTHFKSERKVELFLSRLAADGCSASTQNQAFNAIVFLYRYVLRRTLKGIDALRAKQPERERYCPSVEEMRALLAAVKDHGGYPARLVAHMLYDAGLRVSEPLNVRIRDVRWESSRLVIRDPKHGHDRTVPFSCAVAMPICRQLAAAKAMWQRDRAAGLPVALPGRLATKYRYARNSWQWYWLFPARTSCRHPRTGELVRYRFLECNVQRAVRDAARACGLEGITPHCFRHAYATHAIAAGAGIRAVQEIMGHRSLETLVKYTHALGGVPSPLEKLSDEPAPIRLAV